MNGRRMVVLPGETEHFGAHSFKFLGLIGTPAHVKHQKFLLVFLIKKIRDLNTILRQRITSPIELRYIVSIPEAGNDMARIRGVI
jgi:hypothetical protein